MKTKSSNQNLKIKKARTEIHFVRAFPFYFKLKKEAFSFRVVISTFNKLNHQTGMSVDLIKFNQIAERVLRQSFKNPTNLYDALSKRVRELNKQLQRAEILLISVQFDECRGYSVLFRDQQIELIRKDFATDKKGDLFTVTTYFDLNQKLNRMNLFSHRLGTEEIFIY